LAFQNETQTQKTDLIGFSLETGSRGNRTTKMDDV
jgi:hypothetical protein